MDPSTAGGGQQQQRSQQPVYDTSQGGHYGKSSTSHLLLPPLFLWSMRCRRMVQLTNGRTVNAYACFDALTALWELLALVL